MNPTALDIIRKHTLKPDADYSDSWVLAAMREIYEIGNDHGYTRACAFYVDETNTCPSLKERLKELFPEK